MNMRYKWQSVSLDMSSEPAHGYHFLDEEIEHKSRRLVYIAGYTKDNNGARTYLNCVLQSAIKIDNEEVLQDEYDLGLIYTKESSDDKLKIVNVPIGDRSRIKAKIRNPNKAITLVLLLKLEMEER